MAVTVSRLAGYRRKLFAVLVLSLLFLAGAPPTAVRADAGPAVSLRGFDLDRATVLDLQRAMNAGRLDSAQLTAFYLDRIRRLNPKLHAVIETNPDATRLAAASDRHRRARWRASRCC
jgi:amidase